MRHELKLNLAKGLNALAIMQTMVDQNGFTELSPNTVHEVGLALLSEVVEFMNEMHWKSWKQAHPVNIDRAADEFADILAFLGYLILWMGVLNVSPSQLAEAYEKKTAINIARLAGDVEGYGVRETQRPFPGMGHA